MKPSPGDGGGLGGGEPAVAWGPEGTKPTAADYIKACQEHFGSITLTLTRPHHGGGNALAICEDRSPFRGEEEDQGAGCGPAAH